MIIETLLMHNSGYIGLFLLHFSYNRNSGLNKSYFNVKFFLWEKNLIKHEHRGYCVVLLKMQKALEEYNFFILVNIASECAELHYNCAIKSLW